MNVTFHVIPNKIIYSEQCLRVNNLCTLKPELFPTPNSAHFCWHPNIPTSSIIIDVGMSGCQKDLFQRQSDKRQTHTKYRDMEQNKGKGITSHLPKSVEIRLDNIISQICRYFD